jgi:hypothetical protein
LERFQHPKHDQDSQRFAQVLQEAADAGALRAAAKTAIQHSPAPA